eukprot:11646404-Alexandrium_andersonii.AAC.1
MPGSGSLGQTGSARTRRGRNVRILIPNACWLWACAVQARKRLEANSESCFKLAMGLRSSSSECLLVVASPGRCNAEMPMTRRSITSELVAGRLGTLNRTSGQWPLRSLGLRCTRQGL